MVKTDKERVWTRRMAEWERSGASRRTWCAANEVSVHTFDYWRRQLRAPEARTSTTRRQRLLPVAVNAVGGPQGAQRAVHFHMLFPDGVYRQDSDGRVRFLPVSAPSPEELRALVQTIAERLGRSLERSGLITRDIENAYLAFDPAEEAPIHGLLGHSITYRIATGPREGLRPDVAASSGFSLHAGVWAKGREREKLEHLARYVSRPPVAGERLALTERGQVRYALKTPYRDGTTHVIFEPEDFIARLAALVPKPRAHLIRFHGVFAPSSALRAAVVPSGRGRGREVTASANPPSGSLRRLEKPDEALVLEWMNGFVRDTGLAVGVEVFVRPFFEKRTFFLWEDDGPLCDLPTVSRCTMPNL